MTGSENTDKCNRKVLACLQQQQRFPQSQHLRLATFPASGSLTSVENMMRNDADFRGEDMRGRADVDPSVTAC